MLSLEIALKNNSYYYCIAAGINGIVYIENYLN